MEIKVSVLQLPHPTQSACFLNQNREPSPMIMLQTWTHLRLAAHGYYTIKILPVLIKLAGLTINHQFVLCVFYRGWNSLSSPTGLCILQCGQEYSGVLHERL